MKLLLFIILATLKAGIGGLWLGDMLGKRALLYNITPKQDDLEKAGCCWFLPSPATLDGRSRPEKISNDVGDFLVSFLSNNDDRKKKNITKLIDYNRPGALH